MRLSGRAKGALGIIGVLTIYNGIVAIPVMMARNDEHGITMLAYRRWLIDPTTTVIDVWHVDGDRSMADVDRNVFKAAEALKEQTFGTVELAYHGQGRFLIDGTKFKEVGEDWRGQSVAYLISAIPSAASNMDGQKAFSEWSGGFLGVMLNQMKDHNQLHWSWYLASMSGADPNSQMPDSQASGSRL